MHGAVRLRVTGPHSPATVQRRLAHWATLHRLRGFDGPFKHPTFRTALRLAVRAKNHSRSRKSAKAITRDVLDQLLATCWRGRGADLRDAALLALAFGSGGRRRSEIARLRVEDVVTLAPVAADPDEPKGPKLPAIALRLGRTKTSDAEEDRRALVIGRPVELLGAWLAYSKIESGAIFRRIDRWGRIGAAALDPQAVNAIVKSRCQRAGLEPGDDSAHGIRSG